MTEEEWSKRAQKNQVRVLSGKPSRDVKEEVITTNCCYVKQEEYGDSPLD